MYSRYVNVPSSLPYIADFLLNRPPLMNALSCLTRP